jgi:hypothetical protein
MSGVLAAGSLSGRTRHWREDSISLTPESERAAPQDMRAPASGRVSTGGWINTNRWAARPTRQE